ncbi:hypothetical protein, partial [Vibrio navarrensis]|uniref:hypothetical protein n=1 Tax=Vibrio navarrensis TaxID=29495 RepID=UPI001E5559B4
MQSIYVVLFDKLIDKLTKGVGLVMGGREGARESKGGREGTRLIGTRLLGKTTEEERVLGSGSWEMQKRKKKRSSPP